MSVKDGCFWVTLFAAAMFLAVAVIKSNEVSVLKDQITDLEKHARVSKSLNGIGIDRWCVLAHENGWLDQSAYNPRTQTND